jgi:hypothetical protein
MTYPVANEEQEIDMVLRAAAHSRWVELREQRKPRAKERHDWIRAMLMGEKLRSLDSDGVRLDRLAQDLDRKGVDRWAEIQLAGAFPSRVGILLRSERTRWS